MKETQLEKMQILRTNENKEEKKQRKKECS